MDVQKRVKQTLFGHPFFLTCKEAYKYFGIGARLRKLIKKSFVANL